MMEDDLKKAADLCMIHLDDEELEELVRWVRPVMDRISRLDHVKIPSEMPGRKGADLVLHEDQPKDIANRDDYLKNAPAHEEGYIIVPKERPED